MVTTQEEEQLKNGNNSSPSKDDFWVWNLYTLVFLKKLLTKPYFQVDFLLREL